MSGDIGVRALEACRNYEYWAQETKRLTKAISEERCPDEGTTIEGEESCFKKMKAELCGGDFGDTENPLRPITLQEIGQSVTACSSCSNLVFLIQQRRAARKKFGAAKRTVRHFGKIAETAIEHLQRKEPEAEEVW